MKKRLKMPDGKKVVLIVDDEDGVREIVSEMVSEIGYFTLGAESGEAALKVIDQKAVNLVISDVKMEGMDGKALARRLRSQYPKLPLALMTAHHSEDLKRMLKDKLVDHILLKPFHINELQGMVQKLAG